MDIFDRLPQEDIELINGYINNYGGGDDDSSYMPLSDMRRFLRFWNTNKAPFYKMFGEQFILKKEICFDKDPDVMEEELDEAIRYGEAIVCRFRNHFESYINGLNIDYDLRYELRRFVSDLDMLIRNEYNGEPLVIPGEVTVDGKPFQINRGAKAIKMLGKICKAVGFSLTMYKCPNCGHYEETDLYNPNHCPYCFSNATRYEQIDGYEYFRRAHSLVLNQKKLRGNLCLSIHPLDYITMSDNDCGWQSCMQWMEEAGDYRLGTIEMMNSAYCVVAYVEAKDQMYLWNSQVKWNSKRWRQLLMITPEMLLGNKQYPYFSDDLQGAAMKWLRDLANNSECICVENAKRYGPYEIEALQIMNNRYNKVGTREVYVHFWFDYMYCDIYDYRMAFISTNAKSRIEYNLSGPAVCTNCGDIIYKDSECDVEPHWTTCRSCNDMWRCTSCGEWHHGDAYYAEDSDEPYCYYCYENELERCEICGDRVTHTEGIYINLLPNADEEHECYNWNFIIDVCQYCMRSSDFKALFGEISVMRDMWGRERNVVCIENITDEGLDYGCLDVNTKNTLKLIRDAKSNEERLSLVKKNLY
jgi:predicted Zn-ribbon and HTH transcriptional regulator